MEWLSKLYGSTLMSGDVVKIILKLDCELHSSIIIAN